MDNKEIRQTHVIHGNKIVEGLIKRAERLVMFQIANVLADKSLSIHYQRYRILQVGAEGKNRSFTG